MSTERIGVLDHGYVALVESWGSDESIIEAARMSTGKGFNGWGTADKPGDEKLLRFLWKNKHASPFEMAGAVFEIKAPILVFREWHRHRTQSYNEMSARYTPLPDENYVPSLERLMAGDDGKNKQAGTIPGAGVLDAAGAERFRAFLIVHYEAAERGYQEALKSGVPKELARVHLPVGRYSRMRASANLRNWLAFASLRSTAKNPSAQWEIRVYADAVCKVLVEKFPRTLALFAEQSS
jgi:thymidylate synthase (FAD)